MSLSTMAVDRLFSRLTATYGRDFIARYAGVPESDLKAAWAHELSGFEGQLGALAWALENLPERAPNVIEFRNLARRAPAPEVPRLPEPAPNPARLAAELAKLAPARAAIAASAAGGHDPRDWARRIVARSDSGEILIPTTLRFAREALRGHQ